MNIRQLWEIILHFFFPVSCEKCGRPGKILCDECAVQEQTKPEVSLQPIENEYISFMFEDIPIMKHINTLTIYSASMYYSQIRPLIHDFKYSGKKLLCLSLGRAMGKFFTKPEAEYIIPVPLHTGSPRTYNQAYELAKGIAEVWGLSVLEAAEWAKNIPRRMGLTGQERMELTPEAFRVTENMRNLRVVLVDDVCTTGATLSCLAGALTEAGAVIVCAYSLAMVNV